MLNRIVALAALGATALALRNQVHKYAGEGRTSVVNAAIEVDVPLSTAYNQWTQFEDFPHFMAGVVEVRQLDDTHLAWRARIAGRQTQWDAEITEQLPDRLIAWRSTTGPRHEGRVTFHAISGHRTRVYLRMGYEPRGTVERVADALGAVSLRASGNLRRFKAFLERRGTETGAWRGTVGHAPAAAQSESAGGT